RHRHTLDSSGSTDPQGLPLTYVWSQVAGLTVAAMTGQNASQLTITTPSVTTTSVLTFQLTVTDSDGVSSSATVNVTVKPINQPPVAVLNAPTQVAGGAAVTLDASGSYDPDGDALTYSWTQQSGPIVALNLTNPAKPTFVAPISSFARSLSFQVTVSDGQLTGSAVATVQISAIHNPPIANVGPSQTAAFGALIALNGSASSDPGGNKLTFTWTQTAGPSVALNLS